MAGIDTLEKYYELCENDKRFPIEAAEYYDNFENLPIELEFRIHRRI